MDKSNIKTSLNSINVVRIEQIHLSACIKLDKIALNGLWTKQQWEKEISDPRRICLGVLSSTKLIAIACGWLIVDEFHLTAVAVHPRHRRKGVAERILSVLLDKAIQAGASKATLEVSNKNIAAIELYKKFGFKTAGSRTAYYKNGSNALIQWRHLIKN